MQEQVVYISRCLTCDDIALSDEGLPTTASMDFAQLQAF